MDVFTQSGAGAGVSGPPPSCSDLIGASMFVRARNVQAGFDTGWWRFTYADSDFFPAVSGHLSSARGRASLLKPCPVLQWQIISIIPCRIKFAVQPHQNAGPCTIGNDRYVGGKEPSQVRKRLENPLSKKFSIVISSNLISALTA